MKTKIYMRIAKHPTGRKATYKVHAGTEPDQRPLIGPSAQVLPTVAFAVEFEIPDAAFRGAEQVIAQINIPESELEIAADVTHLNASDS